MVLNVADRQRNQEENQAEAKRKHRMATNLKGISLKGLTKTQKSQMQTHKTHHTKRHLQKMATEMRKGKSFAQSHTVAQRVIGK
tara:strand:- start:202 stop:453 length:252 start_codon:yes stop_codon:yes gene_type:complete